jgi:hypothetical protein
MALGKFTFARDAYGKEIVIRHAADIDGKPARQQKDSSRFVRAVSARRLLLPALSRRNSG